MVVVPRSTAYVVIPARGGSTGVPRKNVQRVGGVPLVARAVRAAAAATTVDRVFVSTDDAEIAAIARAAGAEVIDRPSAISDSTASSESVLLHALERLAEQGDADPDITVMVQCTSPFIDPSDIDATVAVITDGEADCAFTAFRTHAFVWRRGATGVEPVNHQAHERPRRQAREDQFEENGAVYAMRTAGLRSAGHRFFGRIALHEVPAARGLEIDADLDLVVANALEAAVPGDVASKLPTRVEAVVFDFDGVLTDNTVVTHQDGTEAVVADRSDGLGIERLREAGFRLVVMSKERNPVVAARCTKLQIECVQGIQDKGPALRDWLDAAGIPAANTVFVGNDVNDLDCLRLAGCGIVVADAHPDTLAAADAVLTRPGGRGAVRELSDLLLARRGAGAA